MPRWENMKFEAWKYISSFSAATNFFFPPKFLKPEWAEFEVVWRQKWKLFERQKLSKVGGDVTTKAKESRSWAFGSYLMESWISFVWKISPWSKTWYSNGCYLKWNGSVLKSSSSSNLCRFANTRCFFIQQFGASLEWIRINNGNNGNTRWYLFSPDSRSDRWPKSGSSCWTRWTCRNQISDFSFTIVAPLLLWIQFLEWLLIFWDLQVLV